MDWHRFGFWLEDVLARWWWAYIIIGTIAVPLVLHWLGFGGGEYDGCLRYSSFAESC